MAQEVRIAVIGLGTGGLHTVRTLARVMKNAKITVFERREYPTYSPCAMPYALEGMCSFEDLKHPFPRSSRVDVHTGVMVKEINARESRLKYTDGTSEFDLEYDYLVYAAGSTPAVPPIEGVDGLIGNGVYTLKVVEDIETISQAIQGVESATVIGAGAIGLEMAVALRHKIPGSVRVIELLPQIMPSLDSDIASILQKYLEEMGIEFILSTGVREIRREDKGLICRQDNGTTIESDIVILSTGVRPNTELLSGQVEMQRGYIVVDEHMRTTVENIYAVGDCTVHRNYLYGDLRPSPYATAAMKQGIVAAMSIAGMDVKYEGASFAVVSKLGDMEVASCGVKSSDDILSVKARHYDRPEFMGGRPLTLKVLFTPEGRIMGAQAIGPSATMAVSIISALMKKRSSISDLISVEIPYCPAISDLLSPVQLAGEMALRKVRDGGNGWTV